MKLYMHPVSSPSRAVILFAMESGIDVETAQVDLLAGEHLGDDFARINCNRLVPVLEDGDFRLSESSAILKYLAEKTGSPVYPSDIADRARVNEMMDWFNVNFYRDFGYSLIYPQLFPNHFRHTDEATAAEISRGQDRTRRWFGILDREILGPDRNFVCLGRLTLADYLGVCLVTLGDLIDFDRSGYPNVCRWVDGMQALKSWNDMNRGFEGYVKAYGGREFVAA